MKVIQKLLKQVERLLQPSGVVLVECWALTAIVVGVAMARVAIADTGTPALSPAAVSIAAPTVAPTETPTVASTIASTSAPTAASTIASTSMLNNGLIGDPAAGKLKSTTCVACHGEDGNATAAIWPKIAGQHETYLFSQMLEFKKGKNGGRYEPSMLSMLQSFSQQDLADLAAFYSKQKMSSGKAKASLVALGSAIYRGGNIKKGIPACAACHGANGLGNGLAKFPRLSGQNSGYVTAQLKNYKNKIRVNDPNGIMQDIASRLSDEEIEAVSSYIAGLY